MGAAVQERPGDRPDARRGDLLRADLLAVPGRRRPRPHPRGHGRDACGAPWPARPDRWPPDPTATKRLADGAKALRERTDRAIIGLFGGNLLEIGQFLYRIDNFLMLLAGNPRAGPRVPRPPASRSTWPTWSGSSAWSARTSTSSSSATTWACRTGPQMSPAMYREFFKPRHARMWRRAKELADVKVMLHCCGGVRPLLPDLIEAGPGRDQSRADLLHGHGGRGPEGRFRRADHLLGRRLRHAFRPAPRHARARSASTSASRSRSCSPGGGFVFQQVHNILANVPPENVIAMFDAAGQS